MTPEEKKREATQAAWDEVIKKKSTLKVIENKKVIAKSESILPTIIGLIRDGLALYGMYNVYKNIIAYGGFENVLKLVIEWLQTNIIVYMP